MRISQAIIFITKLGDKECRSSKFRGSIFNFFLIEFYEILLDTAVLPRNLLDPRRRMRER